MGQRLSLPYLLSVIAGPIVIGATPNSRQGCPSLNKKEI
jgi:hypothetical protein